MRCIFDVGMTRYLVLTLKVLRSDQRVKAWSKFFHENKLVNGKPGELILVQFILPDH